MILSTALPHSYVKASREPTPTFYWDEFNEPARKHVAVEEPKEHQHFGCPHLLAPAGFRSRGVERPNAQSQDPEAGDLARLPEVRHYSGRL